jgi:hypothetical protein
VLKTRNRVAEAAAKSSMCVVTSALQVHVSVGDVFSCFSKELLSHIGLIRKRKKREIKKTDLVFTGLSWIRTQFTHLLRFVVLVEVPRSALTLASILLNPLHYQLVFFMLYMAPVHSYFYCPTLLNPLSPFFFFCLSVYTTCFLSESDSKAGG